MQDSIFISFVKTYHVGKYTGSNMFNFNKIFKELYNLNMLNLIPMMELNEPRNNPYEVMTSYSI